MPARPHKRNVSTASGTGAATARSKRSKPGPEPEPEPEAEPSATTDPPSGAAGCDDSSDGSTSESDGSDSPPLPRRNRWAKVSASGNLDDRYRKKYRNPQRARKFICLCNPSDAGDDDDWEDEDESDEGEGSGDDDIPVVEVAPRRRCDRGETCLCYKPAKKHPEHSWIMTKAGNELALQSIIHLQLRCPDNFDSYTFNDHEGFGALEVIQNLLRDFEEAAGEPWVRQWAICEALAQILEAYDHFQPLFMIDHIVLGDMTDMIGCMFLTQLATLENEGLLRPDSEVMNLALVMGLYLRMALSFTAMGILDSDDDEDGDEGPSGKENGTAKGKKATKTSAFKYSESCWDLYIFMYAQKHGIALKTLVSSHTEDLLTRLSEKNLTLPESGADPYGWKPALAYYVKECFVPSFGVTSLTTGDSLDLTAWSSAERKRVNFGKKDPLGPRERKAIKDGQIMSLG